jgi:hypothetical protein
MLLTIYNSKHDVYGNRYWAIELTDFGKVIGQGTIGCDNVNEYDCMKNLRIEVAREELPKREFNRLTKDWEYFGSQWTEIKQKLGV